jgi:multimeric flavodoxin WrbA
MNICILNGNPYANGKGFDAYIKDLVASLTARGHQAVELMLRDLEIRSCAGCFGCWVKTPGECVLRDDGARMCREVVRSDLVLFASPLIMGFVSAQLKICLDRLIPLVHPYITLVNGECHHRVRYEHYPLTGLLLQKDGTDTREDLDITAAILARTALNLKSRLVLAKTTDDSVEEVVHEIERV